MIKKRNDKMPSMFTTFSRMLILFVFIPITIITILFLTIPLRQSKSMQTIHYNNHINNLYRNINTHVNYIGNAVTLLEDSSVIRENLKSLSGHGNPEEIAPKAIEYIIDEPISFRNAITNRYISAITIFSKDQLVYYSIPDTSFDFAIDRCINMNFRLQNTDASGSFVLPGDNSSYVYWVEDYMNIYEGRTQGKIIIEVLPIPNDTSIDASANSLTPEYNLNIQPYPKTQYYLYNSVGTVFFSWSNDLIGKSVYHALPTQIVNNTTVANESEDYLVYKNYLWKYKLNVCIVTPKADVFSAINTTTFLFLSATIILSILCLLLIVITLGNFFTPIKGLAQYCNVAKNHKLSLPAFQPRFSEVKDVCDLIKADIDQITKLQKASDAADLKIKEAEIKSLQAQINPHFLFNMLDTIGWKAEQANSKDVSSMISQLGEMLRSEIMLNNSEKITVSQELTYIRHYLNLQKIRYSNAFEYEISADEEILDGYYIPKLSLQPIVENCIVHGLSKISHPGKVNISIWEDVDEIICKITDNGVGFDSEGFFEKPRQSSNNTRHSHVALHNIQNRIQILYGQKYGISIKSQINKGTEVIVVLPIDTGK